MTEWFEDDDFWAGLYPFMFSEKLLEFGGEEVARIISLVEFDGSAVLDLCCGPGRHSVPLAERGYRVTGVDRTRLHLERARERAREADVEVEWVEDDMHRFVREEAFDLAISMYTSIGYSARKTDDLTVLRNLHASLRPGGVLVIETVGKEWLARNFAPVGVRRRDDGSILVELREERDDWTRIHNEWLLIEGDRVRRFEFEHTVYSGQELRDRLQLAGFDEVWLYGNLAGIEYNRQATRLVAVAAKT